MALSLKAKEAIRRAVTDDKAAEELIAAIESAANEQAEAVEDIADPSLADAEEVANKVNELLAALRAASLMAE